MKPVRQVHCPETTTHVRAKGSAWNISGIRNQDSNQEPCQTPGQTLHEPLRHALHCSKWRLQNDEARKKAAKERNQSTQGRTTRREKKMQKTNNISMEKWMNWQWGVQRTKRVWSDIKQEGKSKDKQGADENETECKLQKEKFPHLICL